MEVLDRLQSGLFFQPNVIDYTPIIFQPHIAYDKAQPAVNYLDSASSGPPPFSINSHPTPEVPLPLLSVAVDVDVHGSLCTTKVTQQFSNASASTTQNAKYVFPIYDGSVVTSFRCWIGNGRLLEGAVKAKEAARADFKHAVSQRKVAVLVEELAPEVFETSVGNIPALTTVKIQITYANILKVDHSTGGLVLTIPTSIAPRYGNAPAGYSGNPTLLTEGLRIDVQVSMPSAIRKMESRSHPISVEMGAVSHKNFKDFAAGASSDTVDYAKGRATLSDRRTFLHQDFVLHILASSRESLQSRAIAATQPGQPNYSTIAVTVHPGDLFRKNVNVGGFVGEIIFMVDRSGSMRSKIPSLINVMNIFLRSLPEACWFNIASFGSDVTWLWPSSKRYSQENLDVASKRVDSFRADYGGTDIYRALHSVLDHHNKQHDVPTNVILLTDGEVWDVDRVIQLVRRTVSEGDSNIRFFSLGIGDRVSHRLVEGIGQQGGGYAEVVPESLMGSWQERVIQMLKAALTPSRLQCNVDLGKDLAMKTSEREIAGYTVQHPECIQAPHHIPVLNVFSHFSVYYMVESVLDSLPKTINITATTDKGEKVTAQMPIQTVAEPPAIYHLAAKALMNDYETGQSWLHSLNPDLKSFNPTGFEEVLRLEAEHLGQMWSIPSKWTSYVAIDRTTAQQHAISVHKGDAIEFSQLIRPRNTLTLPPPPPTLCSRRGSHGRVVYGRPKNGDRLRVVPSMTLRGGPTSAIPAPYSSSSIGNRAPDSYPSSYVPSYTYTSNTGYPYENGRSNAARYTGPAYETDSDYSPVASPQPKFQDEEARLFDATKSLRATQSSSLSTHARGSDNEAPDAECPVLKKLKANTQKSNWAINTTESGGDSVRAARRGAYRPSCEHGELGSGVQFSHDAVFDDVQPPLQPSSHLDEFRCNSPESSKEQQDDVDKRASSTYPGFRPMERILCDTKASCVQDRPSSPSSDRDSSIEDQDRQHNIEQTLFAGSNSMSVTARDQYQNSNFRSGPALRFPGIPGEENRNGGLNKIRKQYNQDKFSRSGSPNRLSRVASSTGSISSRRDFEGSPRISSDGSQLNHHDHSHSRHSRHSRSRSRSHSRSHSRSRAKTLAEVGLGATAIAGAMAPARKKSNSDRRSRSRHHRSSSTTNTSSNGMEVRDPDYTTPSDFPVLETILRVQQADGQFLFLSSPFSKALREKYDYNAVENFLETRFNRELLTTRWLAMKWRLADLRYNILIVVYITYEHAASKALWELQVAKARQWIKRTIIELLKDSGASQEALEELGEPIIEEMQKLALRQT